MSFCNGNWYQTVFYSGEKFAVNQPRKAECPDKLGGTAPDWVIEFGITMQLQFLLGAFFLGYLLWRSCSRYSIDPYRLIFLYLMGTVPFMFTLIIGPSRGGFHRLVGYAVLVHNLAEWFIINRIWVGDKHMKRMYSIMYVIVFLILIAILPLWVLFFIAMLQGGFCDYVLLFSFIEIHRWMKKHNNKKIARSMLIACAAASIHLASIQPLFLGMATAYSPLLFSTTLFLIPTFVTYVWFASSVAGKREINLFDPGFGYNILQLEAQEKTNKLLKDLIYNRNRELINDGSGAHRLEMDVVHTNDVVHNDEKEENSMFTVEEICSKHCHNYKEKLDKMGMDVNDMNITPDGEDIYYLLIDAGMNEIDPQMKRVQKKVYIASFIIALMNSFVIIFSPCYLDFSKSICG